MSGLQLSPKCRIYRVVAAGNSSTDARTQTCTSTSMPQSRNLHMTVLILIHNAGIIMQGHNTLICTARKRSNFDAADTNIRELAVSQTLLSNSSVFLLMLFMSYIAL